MSDLSIFICAVEGEIHRCLADGMDENCDVVRRLVRLCDAAKFMVAD